MNMQEKRMPYFFPKLYCMLFSSWWSYTRKHGFLLHDCKMVANMQRLYCGLLRHRHMSTTVNHSRFCVAAAETHIDIFTSCLSFKKEKIIPYQLSCFSSDNREKLFLQQYLLEQVPQQKLLKHSLDAW